MLERSERLLPCRPSPQNHAGRYVRIRLEDASSISTNRIFELILAVAAAVWLISILNDSLRGWLGWLGPAIVLTAPVGLVTLIQGGKISRLGLNLDRPGYCLGLLAVTCLAAFPATLAGLWLLSRIGVAPPLAPAIEKGAWPNWILYQFMYIAVAEEIFFRGYVQSSLLQMKPPLAVRYPRIWQGMTIVISAGVFALAHTIILGDILSVLTFFPGLILGWLFVRTRSLLAPILFHGLANVCYAIMAVILS